MRRPIAATKPVDVEVRYNGNPNWYYYLTALSQEAAEKWVRELETYNPGKVTQARIRPE